MHTDILLDIYPVYGLEVTNIPQKSMVNEDFTFIDKQEILITLSNKDDGTVPEEILPYLGIAKLSADMVEVLGTSELANPIADSFIAIRRRGERNTSELAENIIASLFFYYITQSNNLATFSLNPRKSIHFGQHCISINRTKSRFEKVQTEIKALSIFGNHKLTIDFKEFKESFNQKSRLNIGNHNIIFYENFILNKIIFNKNRTKIKANFADKIFRTVKILHYISSEENLNMIIASNITIWEIVLGEGNSNHKLLKNRIKVFFQNPISVGSADYFISAEDILNYRNSYIHEGKINTDQDHIKNIAHVSFIISMHLIKIFLHFLNAGLDHGNVLSKIDFYIYLDEAKQKGLISEDEIKSISTSKLVYDFSSV